MKDATPLGNLLHLLLFIGGAAILGVTTLAVFERLAGEGKPPTISVKQIAIVASVFVLLVGAEVLFHVLGGS